VSYRHVQALATVRTEFEAAQLAVSHLERSWPRLTPEQERGSVTLAHIRVTASHLESTYIVRLFSEFEGLLYRHLSAHYPGLRIPRTAEALINRDALREQIPDLDRDAAQAVREYRNVLVHRRGARVPELTLQNATAALNRFLRWLPDTP
jgi:hypothetical protein